MSRYGEWERAFTKANPGRDRNDMNDRRILCWVCGAAGKPGVIFCYAHDAYWRESFMDDKQSREPVIWAMDHPDFNGVKVHDPFGGPVLADSPWIANE